MLSARVVVFSGFCYHFLLCDCFFGEIKMNIYHSALKLGWLNQPHSATLLPPVTDTAMLCFAVCRVDISTSLSRWLSLCHFSSVTVTA